MVVGEFTRETHLVVIGGGPGGYSTAFRAAELGIETVIVDPQESLGGTCLHDGCIPSKTLLHIADIIRGAQHAADFGVHYDKPRIDLPTVRAWMNQTTAALSKNLHDMCKRLGVEHVRGEASFEDGRTLSIRNNPEVPRIRFRRAIIATGSQPAAHPALAFDNTLALSPYQALALSSIPKSLLIVGGGYNALELATIYATFGSHVTLVHKGDRVLPEADEDLSRPLAESLEKQLHEVIPNTQIVDAQTTGDQLNVTLQGHVNQQRQFDQAILAIGYIGNTQSLNIDRAALQTDELGFIKVDDQLRTSEPRIFAVGDVAAHNQCQALLADRAVAEGRVAAEVIAGWNSHLDSRAVPIAVFTDPQVAWCGLTETQAKLQNIPHRIARQPWSTSSKALVMGRPDGITKIIYDPDTQLILGMGITGPHAAELISEAALAIEMGAVIADLAAIVHPYVTLSETLTDAALRAERRVNE